MKRILLSWLLIALGVFLSTYTSSGIEYESWGTLVAVVIVLSILNLFLKPLLVFFTLPFVIISLGLGVWLINAVLLMLAGKIVEGFHVASFVSALWGAFVISVTSMIANMVILRKARRRRR